jgi:hypothetical protein
MTAVAVRGLLTEASWNGVCGVTGRPDPSRRAEPPEVDDAVALDDPQGEAGQAVPPHPLAHEGVDARGVDGAGGGLASD